MSSPNYSKEKGSRAEVLVRDKLRELTKLGWERTPLSGALNEKHGLKSDLYIPNEKNLYSVEVKHYKDCHFSSNIFTDKCPQLLEWWSQTVRQAMQMQRKPLLIFKHDRSKIFAAYTDMPEAAYRHAFVSIDGNEFYVSLLEDYIKNNNPKFVA